MEAIKDFESFYNAKIVPQLPALKKANRAAGGLGVGMVFLMLFTVASFIATLSNMWNKDGGTIMTITLLLLSIIAVYKYTRIEKGYTARFKEDVIAVIINYLKADIIYTPKRYVPAKDYKLSALYREGYDYYEGDDLLQGTYKGINFYCSELHTRYVKTTNRSMYEVTIFKGLFFVATIDQRFSKGTYVWPKEQDQFVKSKGRAGWMWPPKVNRLVTDDTVFESCFCAYSANEEEAKAILTPRMMNLLVNFRSQLKRRISFSVVAGKCYVSIPIKEDLLEPSTDPTDKEAIKKHFFTILLVFSIINQLELNKLLQINKIK